MKNKTYIVIVPIFFIVLIILKKIVDINAEPLADSSFLFTYLGIFLGFSITLFSFIVSMIESIRDRLRSNKKIAKAKKKDFYDGIKSLYREIKDNIMIIFIFFIIIIVIKLFGHINIPLISIPSCIEVSKTEIFSAIKLEILLLSLYSIYDLISCSFQISNLTCYTEEENHDDQTP